MSKFHHVCSLTGLAHWARRFTHLLHHHLESSPRHNLTKVSPVSENMSRRYDSRSAGGSLTTVQFGHLRTYKKKNVGALLGTTECRHLRPQSHFPREAKKPTHPCDHRFPSLATMPASVPSWMAPWHLWKPSTKITYPKLMARVKSSPNKFH